MVGLINITPGPQVIPGFFIGWYGLLYVVGLAVLLIVSQREAERRGFAPSHIWNALLVVAAFALIGARLYHVIDQWAFYSQDPLKAVLPPYSGLGLYGGIAGAMVGILLYVRWKRLPFRLALDIVIPGTLFAQGIARWGNFFNQELYGPPTDAPWGIAIECVHRVAPWFCPGDPRLTAGASGLPLETTGFHPLFFYESSLDIAGGLVALYLSRRFLARLQPGDLAAFWGIWYGLIRAYLETFREGWNWTLGGIPTAMLIGFALAAVGTAWLIYNHRPGAKPYEYLPPYEPPEAGDDAIQDDADDEDEDEEDDELAHGGEGAVKA